MMDRPARVRNYLLESAEVTRNAADGCVESIVAAAGLMAETFTSGGKVLLCGNGGSRKGELNGIAPLLSG